MLGVPVLAWTIEKVKPIQAKPVDASCEMVFGGSMYTGMPVVYCAFVQRSGGHCATVCAFVRIT